MAKSSKSIEEQIEDWCKKQFKGQKYYTKTETVNAEIASALEKAPSKQGGTGKNFPDLKCLLTGNDGKRIPVMIEVKGRKGEVNKDSYVWDYATGSAGFLISAMHQMIEDAKQKITSPHKLEEKIHHIKMEQLLGIEKLPDVYMLAVLNMILMKDGSANIIQGNSLEYDGNYKQGKKKDKPFPANVFFAQPALFCRRQGIRICREGSCKDDSWRTGCRIDTGKCRKRQRTVFHLQPIRAQYATCLHQDVRHILWQGERSDRHLRV